MADFDPTKIPEIVQQRLDATAADTQQRAQTAFEEALADQRQILGSLSGLATALIDATSANSIGAWR